MAKKILIVENDPLILRMFQEKFENDGYDVFCTENQDDIIEKAKELMPNIILLNTNMPNDYKLEILKSIKKVKELKKIPVIFITNSPSTPEEIDNVNACGGSACVNLNLDPSELTKKVKELIGN